MSGEEGPRNNRASKRRTIVVLACGVVAAVATGLVGSWWYAFSVGWGTACVIYLVWVWMVMGRKDGESTRRHASQEDPAKTTSDTLLLLASLASLVALVIVATQAKSSPPPGKYVLALLGAASVAASWFFVHTLYTLRYAVLYYAEGDKPIDFNQEAPPRYVDFAYLAFTVGMTFQVSDTNIRSTAIRATLLRHMMLSYLFGAVILAVAVNLVASLAQ
ncbi:MAG: DUF1345 domain-containing protein [Leifsonia sp.]